LLRLSFVPLPGGVVLVWLGSPLELTPRLGALLGCARRGVGRDAGFLSPPPPFGEAALRRGWALKHPAGRCWALKPSAPAAWCPRGVAACRVEAWAAGPCAAVPVTPSPSCRECCRCWLMGPPSAFAGCGWGLGQRHGFPFPDNFLRVCCGRSKTVRCELSPREHEPFALTRTHTRATPTCTRCPL
jgi:hypothetical protein